MLFCFTVLITIVVVVFVVVVVVVIVAVTLLLKTILSVSRVPTLSAYKEELIHVIWIAKKSISRRPRVRLLPEIW